MKIFKNFEKILKIIFIRIIVIRTILEAFFSRKSNGGEARRANDGARTERTA